MTKCELKLAMLKCPEVVRSILLSDANIQTIEKIKLRRTMTAADLAAQEDISIQSASAQLKRLHSRGYLGRKQTPDSTGGFFYTYRYDLLEHSYE